MPEHVLIVDDDRLVLQSTRLVLLSARMRVSTASGGEQGIQSAKTDRPDVILLDIMMPRMDGWETLSRLRDDPDTRDIPVIIFTAREHARGRRLAQSMGAVDYLAKPFEPDELIAMVKEHASVAEVAEAVEVPEAVADAAKVQ